ncbi:MAG: hypothetical protein AAF580_05585 [Pseudomonadota bacterium]
MVKMMRSPQRYQLGGELDAWEGRATSQGLSGYSLVDPYRPITPAASQRPNAQRIIPRAHAPYQSRSAARDAGKDDFRALAQSIERRRILSAKAEPKASSLTSSMTSSRLSPTPNRTPVRPIAERWQSDDYPRSHPSITRNTRPRTPEPTARDRPKANATADNRNRADLSEIARLESVLDEVLCRLQVLERANEERPAARRSRSASTSQHRTAWRDELPSRSVARPQHERAPSAASTVQPRAEDEHSGRPRRLFRR